MVVFNCADNGDVGGDASATRVTGLFLASTWGTAMVGLQKQSHLHQIQIRSIKLRGLDVSSESVTFSSFTFRVAWTNCSCRDVL